MILGVLASISKDIILSKNTCCGLWDIRRAERAGLAAVPSDVSKSLDFSSQFSY